MPTLDTPIGVLTWDGRLSERTLVTMPDGQRVRFYSIISHTNGEALLWLDAAEQQTAKTVTKAPRAAVENALAMLQGLPVIMQDDDGRDLIAVPWPIRPRPALDPDVWIDSTVQDVAIPDLYASQPYLNRARVADFVRNPGAIEAGRRALANVYDDGQMLIVDGHHRLAAWWLLGADRANVWYLEK
jgi:hypothetical protein